MYFAQQTSPTLGADWGIGQPNPVEYKAYLTELQACATTRACSRSGVDRVLTYFIGLPAGYDEVPIFEALNAAFSDQRSAQNAFQGNVKTVAVIANQVKRAPASAALTLIAGIDRVMSDPNMTCAGCDKSAYVDFIDQAMTVLARLVATDPRNLRKHVETMTQTDWALGGVNRRVEFRAANTRLADALKAMGTDQPPVPVEPAKPPPSPKVQISKTAKIAMVAGAVGVVGGAAALFLYTRHRDGGFASADLGPLRRKVQRKRK